MMQQKTDQWFQARLGKATASRFDDIVRGPKLAGWRNYLAELVTERLTGQRRDNFQSAEMMWGIDNEPLARLLYMLSTKNEVEETGFWEHDKLAAGASPDGLINNDMVLEIKCPNTATHLETLHSGKIPNKYIAQVQGQLWITNRQGAHFVSFDPRMPENAKMIIIDVPRDNGYIKLLENSVGEFLDAVNKEMEFVKNYGVENEVQPSK